MRKQNAWRFEHPDVRSLVRSSGDASPSPGLAISSTGRLQMVDEARSVRQAVFLLLTTRPGERVMRPDYGCELHRLVFDTNDETTAGLAMHYVRTALKRWEPRADVLRVDAEQVEDGRLDVVVEYRVRALNLVDRVVLPLSVAEGAPR